MNIIIYFIVMATIYFGGLAIGYSAGYAKGSRQVDRAIATTNLALETSAKWEKNYNTCMQILKEQK